MQGQMVDERPALPTEKAARYCGCKPSTFKTFRSRHKGPPFYRGAGKRILYKRSDLDAWIESRRVEPSAEEKAVSGNRTSPKQGPAVGAGL